MKESFKKKILKNGMTILFEKRSVPVVSMILAAKSGSTSEELSEKGISHFIEHLMYKGTKNRSAREIAQGIEQRGGELNGFTSEEVTGYWCKMPSKTFREGMDVLIDIMKNSLFDEKEMEKERKVIFEEMKMYVDNPRLHVFNEIQKCLFGGTLSIDTIGTVESMKSINREKILQKFKEIYAPDNLIFCVVGDADFDEIVKIATDNFGNEKKKISPKKITFKNEIKIEERKGIDQANLVFGYHVPLARDEKSFSARVLNSILADGMSSRLFAEIREKRNLAYAVKGGSEISRDFAYNFVYVGTMKENVEEIKGLILKEFKKISEDLDEEELNQIKNKLIGNYQISMEDSQVQMVNLLAIEVHTKAEDFYNFEKNIKKVQLEDVKKLASEVKEGNYSFFALVPGN